MSSESADPPHLRPFDDLLVAELRAVCERARALSVSEDGLPTQQVPTLLRTPRGLQAGTREEPNWQVALATLSRRPGFWRHMAELAAALSNDPHVDAAIGWERDPERRAAPLWQMVIGPTVVRYARRRPDWSWAEPLARNLVAAWRASHNADLVWHRTIAPLHNLRGMPEPVEIDDDLVIRRMTNQDRDGLWRHFGAGGLGPVAPTVSQLEAWTDVIDLRWAQPKTPPLSDEPAIARIADVVTALRLHHPGVTGTTILWTHLDPPDAPGGSGHRLYAPHGTGLYMHPLQTHVGSGDAPSLRTLVHALAAAREDRLIALARRRFDTAYERHNREDALVDLWIAFEALLVPDSPSELRYRAALRIARLAGPEPADREHAFALAKRSYDARSKVVHGATPPADLDKLLENTRQLARIVLRRWVLDPPPGGVDELDRALLT